MRLHLPAVPARRLRGSGGTRLVLLLALLGLIATVSAPAAQAQVSVTGNFFSIGGGLFQYQANVTNNSPFTLDLVDLDIAGVLAPLTAPTGFINTYDGGLNLLTFAEDADLLTPQTFAPGTTVGFFTFRANAAFTSVPFTALDRPNGNFTPGTANFTASAAAPEPGALAFLALGLTGFAARRRSNHR
jgi:MYXO-CTERM domain-containing protein